MNCFSPKIAYIMVCWGVAMVTTIIISLCYLLTIVRTGQFITDALIVWVGTAFINIAGILTSLKLERKINEAKLKENQTNH